MIIDNKNTEEIKRNLWNEVVKNHGSMEINRYKDYVLGFMFYKYLSDKTLAEYAKLKEIENDDNIIVNYANDYKNLGDIFKKLMTNMLSGYFIQPEHLYQQWIKDIETGNFAVQKIIDSFNTFERSIDETITGSQNFKGLFDNSVIDLEDISLGNDLNKRNKNIKDLILLFKDFNMVSLQKDDIIGDIFEYLVAEFAKDSGTKAESFYTQYQISEIMAQIIALELDTDKIDNNSIYDPTIGSGSLVLKVKKYLPEAKSEYLQYYGQEIITSTYNIARMNLLLHGVTPPNIELINEDVFINDSFSNTNNDNKDMQYNAVIMDPPFGKIDWNKRNLKVSDPRFESYGVLPPKKNPELAFLLQGFYHLNNEGVMAVLQPHGPLFRGGSEEIIRKELIENNQIDTIIGLPAKLTSLKGIPVCIIILKKNKAKDSDILFIDASSSQLIKSESQNIMLEKDIAKIIDTYTNRVVIPEYSHLADKKEIIENDYNLNITRYVEKIEDHFPLDVDAILYGGIPKANIDSITLLNCLVKNIINSSFKTIREGYLKLNKSINQLKSDILSDDNILKLSNDIQEGTKEYLDKYWHILHNINNDTNLNVLKKQMRNDIKELLSKYEYVDKYDGLQIIENIWDNYLNNDCELIANNGFYNSARTINNDISTKKYNNYSLIIPNELIAKILFSNQLKLIEDYNGRFLEIDNEYLEMVELAKIEESFENEVLYDCLKRNKEDEPENSFNKTSINKKIKSYDKDSEEYKLLKRVKKLLDEKKNIGDILKVENKKLNEDIYNSIEKLSNEEIDSMIYEKWFGSTVNDISDLLDNELNKEIDIIDMLNNRYLETLSDIDNKIDEVNQYLESMMKELEVS